MWQRSKGSRTGILQKANAIPGRKRKEKDYAEDELQASNVVFGVTLQISLRESTSIVTGFATATLYTYLTYVTSIRGDLKRR